MGVARDFVGSKTPKRIRPCD